MNETIAGSYQVLRKEVVRVLLQGHERARQAVERERAQAYWEVGRILDEHLRTTGGESGYGNRVMGQLAEDLEMETRRLYNMLEVFRAFEKLNADSILTFTHYLHISRVANQEDREELVERCEVEGWSVSELKVVLGDSEGEDGSGIGVAALPEGNTGGPVVVVEADLVPKKGRLFTYRLLATAPSEAEGGRGGEVKLDLGFRIRLSLPTLEVPGIEPGKSVECVADSKGEIEYGGRRFRLVVDNKPRTKLYTFGAQVLRIIDGDTLWVEIDCGFGVSIKEKLRLRGIDTPEMSGDEGVMARLFVGERLKEGSTIVLTTSRSDLYDRYVADVFFLPNEEDTAVILAQGLYLNRELLIAGLATRIE
jgi:endonuclease YncB( thermonuclease family)